MRREYYNYIKENVKNNLNKKLLNEVLVDDPIEHNIPPREWRRRYAPFANENPATNQPMFSDPPKPTPPQAPIDRGTFEDPTPDSPPGRPNGPPIYRITPTGEYEAFHLVLTPYPHYARVPGTGGLFNFTQPYMIPNGAIIWNIDESRWEKWVKPWYHHIPTMFDEDKPLEDWQRRERDNPSNFPYDNIR